MAKYVYRIPFYYILEMDETFLGESNNNAQNQHHAVMGTPGRSASSNANTPRFFLLDIYQCR